MLKDEPDEPAENETINKYLTNASAAIARAVATARRPLFAPRLWSRATRYITMALPAFCFRTDERSSRVAPSDTTFDCRDTARFYYTNPLMVRRAVTV